MITGHFGFAAGVKYPVPAAPLWALMLGTQWIDVLFIPLLVSGIETITPAEGTAGGYGTGIIHADYTHSLLGAIVLSGIYGAFFLRLGRQVAATLGAVAFSHWILDLIVHRADLPILPGNLGNLPRLGFGLWQIPTLSILLELLLVLGGAALYWRAGQRVARPAGAAAIARVNVVAALIVIFGMIVLALDATGVLG